jgi:hypothetical protein
MSETMDLTLLSGGLQDFEREVRLSRVQLDQLAGVMPARFGSIEARLGGIDARPGVMQKSGHDLTTEINREFGQVRQQLTHNERRFDAVEAGLASLQTQLAESTERLILAIASGSGPTPA